MKTLILSAAAITLLSGGVAMADEGCTVPQADWQPQEALQQKLEAEGWTVRSIEVDDGCYEVYAVNAAGERMEGEFNPQTLAMLADEGESEDDDGDGF